MPKVATPAATKPAPAKNGNGKAPSQKKLVEKPRELLYPEITVNGVPIPADKMVIHLSKAKALLDLVTEEEWPARFREEHPEFKGDKLAFPENYFTIKDMEGQTVCCLNSTKNRPFVESHALSLAQDILNRNWAGPTTIPGTRKYVYGGVELTMSDGRTLKPGDEIELPEGTVNGETVIQGRTGEIISGNHSLVGLYFACQMWKGANADHWRKLWPVEPYIEKLVVSGVSEAPRVVMTIDNTRPRSDADVIYTMPIFTNMNPPERKEVARMLEKAIAFLWERTGAGEGGFHKYQTRSESQGFLKNHDRLTKCVKHLFEENAERAISKLKLSPGACAGAMYLMGASASDGDAYRNMEAPGEKKIAWDNWDKAEEFWSLLGTSAAHGPTRAALLYHTHSETGEKVNVSDQRPLTKVEQFCILAKAWRHLLDPNNGPLTAGDLTLEYTLDEKADEKVLSAHPDFGGIDAGPKKGEPVQEEVEETVEQRKDRIRQEKADETLAAAAKVAPPEAIAKEQPKFVRGKPVGTTPDAKPPADKEAQKRKLLENRANGKAGTPAKPPLKGGIGSAPAPVKPGKTRAEIEAEMYSK